jgi:hypothetical protein
MNPQLMHWTLGRSDFLRQLEKILCLFVTGLHLELSELSRFFLGQEQNQAFKLDSRLAGLVSEGHRSLGISFPDSPVANYELAGCRKESRLAVCSKSGPLIELAEAH